MAAVITVATITCPECGARTREEMPTNACRPAAPEPNEKTTPEE